jgi:hypothetical protein
LVLTNFSALLTANAKPICSSSCTTSTPRYSMAVQPLQVHSRRKLMQSFKRVISWSRVDDSRADLDVKDASLFVLCWFLYGSLFWSMYESLYASLYGSLYASLSSSDCTPPPSRVPDSSWVERSTSISTGINGHVPSPSCIDVPCSDTWSRTIAPWQPHKLPFFFWGGGGVVSARNLRIFESITI